MSDELEKNRKLPQGWKLVPLINLLTSLETGSRPEGGAIGITNGVPSLSAEHITRYGAFDFSSIRYVPNDFYERMPRGHIRQNDILIVKDGATTGKAAFVDDTFPFSEAVVNEHVFLCRPNPYFVLPRYLFLWVWGSEGQSAVRMHYRGAAIGGINQNFAESLLVPLPPLSEQKRIAAILNEQMEAVQKVRKATEAQLEAVKALPAAYLQKSFLPRGQELPIGWRWVRLGNMAELLPSKSIASDGDSEVRAITTASLTEVCFNPAGVKQARMWSKDVALCTVTPGEVLIARSNTPELVGRAAMFEGEPYGAVASDLTIRVRPNDGLDSAYLSRYLSSIFARGYWKDAAGGASGSMKKITRTHVAGLRLPLPPLSEQKRIAVILNEQMKVVGKVRMALEAQLEHINALPASLLRRAFEGGL